GLSRPDRARAADRDAAARPAAPRASRRDRRAVRLQGGEPAVRTASVPHLRQARRRAALHALGTQPRRRRRDAGDGGGRLTSGAAMIRRAPTRYHEIRDAVRALCAQFPDSYHREIDAQRGYPEAFVAALTSAGSRGAALTP